MAWRLSGTYVANCHCQLICPCPIDGPPTGPGGTCRGLAVFQVREGNLDDIDLSGTTFAFANLFPSNLSAGNWKFGIIVDEAASEQQTRAFERILRGQEGGPFADFAPLFGEWLGVKRAPVSFTDGERPRGKVGNASIDFEPLPGATGGNTTVKNAMFGFAPEFRIGKAPGHSDWFGLDFDGVYGETADYEFASQGVEGPKGRI